MKLYSQKFFGIILKVIVWQRARYGLVRSKGRCKRDDNNNKGKKENKRRQKKNMIKRGDTWSKKKYKCVRVGNDENSLIEHEEFNMINFQCLK